MSMMTVERRQVYDCRTLIVQSFLMCIYQFHIYQLFLMSVHTVMAPMVSDVSRVIHVWFVQADSSMSSKQLALSADNLLSLQMDSCLTLSSLPPSGRFAESLPVSLSPAASEVCVANCRPLRRKRRLYSRPISFQSPSAKPRAAVPDCDCVESRSCLAASSIDSGHDCNSDALHNVPGDVSTVQLKSDAADVDDAVCSSRVRWQAVNLPRSGSHITRKKAFYNTQRPRSIVRRDSSSSASDECASMS